MAGRPRVLFLPGASGDGNLWRPVGERLPASWEKVYWPGLGDQGHCPSVRGFEDLGARVAAALKEPGDLVAHSMGGMIALRVAIGHPEKVRRLVLCATSGGVDMGSFGAADLLNGGTHDFALENVDVVARMVAAHLG